MIGSQAFEKCESLEKVVMFNKVANLESHAFKNCKSLKEITLSNKLKSIDPETFFGCKSLKEIILPASVERLDIRAFAECKALKGIVLPNKLNYISNSVFENSGLESNTLKINVLNLFKKCRKTTKDPLQLTEEISVHIILFILKKSLHKIQQEIITSKLFQSLANSPEFQQIKDLVAELQVVDLKYILSLNDEHKFTFWINIFNFLTIFAIIYRKENILTYYEWLKLKKNSHFNIGGINFSLFEIETNILGNKSMSKQFFAECYDFPIGDSRNKFKINNSLQYMNFAIYEPMTSCFKLQIYFPQTIKKQILKNAIDYFNSKIIVDGKNIVVKVPEYLSWADINFLENLDDYKIVLNKDVYNFIKKNQDKVEFIKHDWSLNFSDSVS